MNIKETIISASDQKTSDEVILCKRCGKPLFGNTSRLLGYGPVCYKIFKKEKLKQRKFDFYSGKDVFTI